MKKTTLFCFITMLSVAVSAQISIGGNPFGFSKSSELPINNVPFVTTPILDLQAIAAEDAQNAGDITKIGVRFGIEHAVNNNLTNSGTWKVLNDGSKVWRLGIECPGALSINLIFDRYHIPDGAKLYLYNEDFSALLGGFTSYNNQEDYFFATDILVGDKMIVEYSEPAQVDFEGELQLSTIVHGYRPTWGTDGKSFGESGSCQINVKCPIGDEYADQIRSVFALYSGGSELCSGTILNNTAQDFKPYALTANHCYTAASNTGIWVFRFNWQSPVCSPSQNSTYQTMTGAVKRATKPTNTSGTDVCLVELNQTIPDSYNVYYCGWTRATTATATGVCISHPSLDIKKITPATITSTTQYIIGWKAQWQQGACTEGGSSGSGLFDANHRLIGQEYGGPSYCGASTSNMYDVYGKFDVSWEGTSAAVRLKDWLDPIGLDPEFLDGTDKVLITDAQLLEITEPLSDTSYRFTTTPTIAPKVIIKNSGNVTITQAVVSYTIDGGTSVPFTWAGSLASLLTAEVTLPAFAPSTGHHILTVTVTVEGDTIISNNSMYKEFDFVDDSSIGNINSDEFTIYPNPASSILNVKGIQLAKTEIYTQTGVLVRTVKNNNQFTQIEISDLSEGIYFINATDNQGKLFNRKLVIVR